MADSQPEPTIESIASLPAEDAPTVAPIPAPKEYTTTLTPPKATSSSSSSSHEKKSAASLAAMLSSAPSNTDKFLTHLLKCVQSRAGADAVLFFLTYSTSLSAVVLESLAQNILRQSAHKIVSLLFQLPPESTVVLTGKPTPPFAARIALGLAGSLRATSGMLSEWRAMGRLFGLLSLYFAAKKLVLKGRAAGKSSSSEKPKQPVAASSSEDRFDFALACAQVTSLIAFQALENVAFLSSKKILPFSPPMQGKMAIWSVRAWASYVGMEIGKLVIERQRKGSFGRKEPVWSREWRKSMMNNLAWAPLTVHWSLPGGVFPAFVVPAFAIIPATSAIHDLWKNTA